MGSIPAGDTIENKRVKYVKESRSYRNNRINFATSVLLCVADCIVGGWSGCTRICTRKHYAGMAGTMVVCVFCWYAGGVVGYGGA